MNNVMTNMCFPSGMLMCKLVVLYNITRPDVKPDDFINKYYK